MTYIPSLTQVQLEILRTAKQYSGKTVRLSYEIPISHHRRPPIKNPPLIQEMVELGLIEVQFKQVISGSSPFQRDSWHEYCADLDLPSIRAWELWRNEFIASQSGAPQVLSPGEDFEDFSDVWIQTISFHATQPS